MPNVLQPITINLKAEWRTRMATQTVTTMSRVPSPVEPRFTSLHPLPTAGRLMRAAFRITGNKGL